MRWTCTVMGQRWTRNSASAHHHRYLREIAAGVDLVQRYLLSQGYVDAKVDAPVTTRQTGGTVDIAITIHPGDQWHIGDVVLSGAPPRLEMQMKADAETLKGQAANEATVEAMRRKLEGSMKADGYYKAEVRSGTANGGGRVLNISFAAVPGALHHVGKVEIDPAFSQGTHQLIENIFRPALNRPYDSTRTELRYRRAVDTEMFEALELEQELGADDTLMLRFSGEEAKRNSIGVSGGYDTFLGAIAGLEWKNVNFWDTGDQVRIKVTGTQLGFLAGVQWKNPALFGTPYVFSIELMPETFTFEGYSRNTYGLRAALSRDFTRNLSAELHVVTSLNYMSSDTLTIFELGPDEYLLSEGGLTVRYEGRDNPISPTRGWFASGTVEGGATTGGFSDVTFTRTSFAAAWYLPLTDKWRTAVGAHFESLISGQDVGYIPIELRNYNGGAKGVRSFAERELGPIADDGTPLGGTQSETVSVEVCYEIMENLELAAFTDVGSLSLDEGGILPNFDDVRYAAGLGLRYRLPFGPFRVDYGVNLNRRTGEKFGALHVGFGFAF